MLVRVFKKALLKSFKFSTLATFTANISNNLAEGIYSSGDQTIFLYSTCRSPARAWCMLYLTYTGTGVMSMFNPIIPRVQDSCQSPCMIDLTYWWNVYI